MSDLKPCPFCGCDAPVLMRHEFEDEEFIEVNCPDCGAHHDGDEWNTRPIEYELRKKIREAQEIAAHYWKKIASLESQLAEAQERKGNYVSSLFDNIKRRLVGAGEMRSVFGGVW